MQCCVLGVRDIDAESERLIRTVASVGGNEDVPGDTDDEREQTEHRGDGEEVSRRELLACGPMEGSEDGRAEDALCKRSSLDWVVVSAAFTVNSMRRPDEFETMLGLPSIAVEWLGVGALLVVLGYLIRFRQWTFLVAGYDETSRLPDGAVANIAGNTVLRLGLATLGLGVVFALADPPAYLPLVFGVVVLVAVVRLLYRLRTYAPADSA